MNVDRQEYITIFTPSGPFTYAPFVSYKRNGDIAKYVRGGLLSAIYLFKEGKTDLGAPLALHVLGCPFEEFVKYIESKWDNGMNWDNYGLWKKDQPMTWHIDHIRPCSSFNLFKISELLQCFHYTNLQPLWAIDNFKKGSKWHANT